MKVNVIVAVAEGTVRAAYLLNYGFNLGLVAGNDNGVCGVTERLSVFVTHITKLAGESIERFLKDLGSMGGVGCCAEKIAVVIITL